MAKEITQKLGFNASGAIRSLTNLKKKLDESTGALTAFKAAGGNLGQLQQLPKTMDKAAKKSNEFLVSWQTIGRVIQTQILLRSINAITSSLSEAVERARELGLRIAEIQTIGQGLAMTSADMTRKIIEASSEIAGVSADAFAEGIYQTLSNQVVDVGEAFEFTSKAAVLAKVTMTDTKDAINALSSVMNSYGMNASQAGHVSDTLFKTVELGRLRLADLANILGRVTPLTAELGVRWEKVAAASAVMTRQGTRTDTALTQLRAIVSALLKPSDDLGKIFRRWGVRDAKEAIAAFGGLGGVLQKLSKETGGSTAEMADLLKNVRAISGFFGTMTKEGKALEESLNGITNATGALQTAWDRFKEEPAQLLSKEMETYTNLMTQLGSESMPQVIFWYKLKNVLARDALKIVRWMNGEYTDQGKFLKSITDTMEKGSQELEVQEEILARLSNKDWNKALQGVNLYYTELNKQEMNYQRIRDNGMAGAQAVFEQSGKNLVNIYSDAVKELENVIKKAKDAGKESAKEIAEIDKKLADKRLQGRLDRAPDRMKMSIFDQEYASQLRKVVDAFGAIDASPTSKERAMNEAKILETLAQQGLAQAKQLGHAHTINKWQRNTEASLLQQRSISELSAKEQKAAIPAAEEKLALMKVEESRLKALMKDYTDLRMQLTGTKDPASRKLLEEQIEDIKGQMKTIFKDVELSVAFFESLGVGENLQLLTSELEIALNKAEKNWDAEVARMNAAFERQTLPIKLAADPQGLVARAAQAMGMEKHDTQTEAAFAADVTDRAKQMRSAYNEAQVDILKQESAINNTREAGNKILKDGLEVTRKRIWEVQRGEIIAGQRRRGDPSFQMTDHVKNYRNALKSVWEEVQKGNKLTNEQRHTLEELRKIAITHNKPLEEQINNYAKILTSIDTLVESEHRLEQARKKSPDEDAYKAADDLLISKQKESELLKENKDLTALAAEEIKKNADITTSSVIPAAQKAADTAGVMADNSTAASGSAFLFGQHIGNAIPGLSRVADIALTVAERMERAAAANAKLGSGSTVNQYHGGPMSYFAFGGRGQDKIPAMLSKKETVVNARNSQRFFSELNAMNQGSQPVYREQGGTVTNVGDINVTVQGGDSSQQTVREIGRAMRREVQRGTIKLR